MGAYLYTNVASLAAQRNLATSQDMLKVSTERLSSGKRINSAKDDSGGVAIAKRFQGNAQGLRQGVRNAADGAAMADAGEAVLEQMAQMALRIREIAVQSANGIYADSNDRAQMTTEVSSLSDGIQALADNAKYNGKGLLDNSEIAATDFVFSDQGGKTSLDLSSTAFDFSGAAASSLADGVDTAAHAGTSIAKIDTFLDSIATARAGFASVSVTLGYQGQAQSALAEAIDTARSRIEDTDYAQETGNMTRNQILMQAATAALAQANAMPNSILSLIK